MNRSVTFTKKDIERLVAQEARRLMPDCGGTLSVSSSISPGTDDRFHSTPGSFTITAVFSEDDEEAPKRFGSGGGAK
jgi:hypothetical protein